MLSTAKQPFARVHQGALACAVLVIKHVPALRISTAPAKASFQYLTICRRLNSPYLHSDASIVNITACTTSTLLLERKNPPHVSVPGLSYRTRTRAHVTSLIPPHCTLKSIRCQHSGLTCLVYLCIQPQPHTFPRPASRNQGPQHGHPVGSGHFESSLDFVRDCDSFHLRYQSSHCHGSLL